MNGKAMLSRRISVTACAAVMLASSIGSASAEAQESRAIESINRYCQASWRNARIDRQDWQECTQQTFVELLDHVSRDRWIEAIENNHSDERRELNRSIWRVAQRWRRAPRFRHGPVELLAQTPDKREKTEDAGLEAVVEILSSPEAGLSARQQDVMQRWLAGDSIAEIASDLDLAPARISDEKYKAIRKLRAVLA